MARNARRLRPNDPLSIDNSTTLTATVESIDDGGSIALRFNLEGEAFSQALHQAGALITNFHLPKSTLFMLTCAFAGHTPMRAAYHHAIAHQYRFYSYGDATLIERNP